MKRLVVLFVVLSLVTLTARPVRAQLPTSQQSWEEMVCVGDQLIYVTHVYTEVVIPEVGTLWGIDRLYGDGRVEHLYGDLTTDYASLEADLEAQYPNSDDPLCRACIETESRAAADVFRDKKLFAAARMPIAVGLCGFTGPGFWACVAAAYAALAAEIYIAHLDYRERLRQIPYSCTSSSGRPCKSY